MKNHNGPRSRSRTPTPHSCTACRRINWSRSRSIGRNPESNRYVALSTRIYLQAITGPAGRRTARPLEQGRRRRGGGGGRRERSHCKLTVIAFNVTRVYGRIKVNCSKWRSMRPKKRSQLAFVYSCDRREKSTIRKLQKRAFFRIDDKKKKMERWHSIDLTLFFTHHYYLRLWRQKRKNT